MVGYGVGDCGVGGLVARASGVGLEVGLVCWGEMGKGVGVDFEGGKLVSGGGGGEGRGC